MKTCPLITPALLAALLLTACKEPAIPSAMHPDGVTCVGATPAQLAPETPHARLFFGQVRAPLQAPAASGMLRELLVPSAHAFALDGEQPLVGARVVLTRIDAQGNMLPHPLLSTRTDEQGRYCLLAPAAWQEDARGWMLVAYHEEVIPLRQLALAAHDADLNTSTEALVQVASDQGLTLSTITPSRWLNMRTVADTATGLFGQVEVASGEHIMRVLLKLKEALIKDERLLKMMARREAD